MTYRIEAGIKGGYREPQHHGYNVADFFSAGTLARSYETAEAAEMAARAAYLGPDTEGVEVEWDVVEIDEPIRSMDFIDRIKEELADCVASARREGWEGERYDYTKEDIDSVIKAIGRRPTREEWTEAGLGWVGGSHCADPE